MRGFSLIELLIVIVIISILASIAYPSYTSHMIKVRRVDGQTALLHLAAQLEKYAITHNSYQDANFTNLKTATISSAGYYQLAIIQADQTAYVISATAIKSQRNDTQCNPLAMNSSGEKGRLLNNHVYVDQSCW